MFESCIEKILRGPWHFIQLRGNILSHEDIDRGDVDFLGNVKSINALIAASYQWVVNELCHVHICARKFGKKVLILYSPDGTHRLVLDLWYSLPQLSGTHVPLVYDAVAQFVKPYTVGSSISRFDIDIEACIYLHHLVVKKKDLTLENNLTRLNHYINTCKDSSVKENLQRTFEKRQVDRKALSESLSMILKIVDPSKTKLANNFIRHLKQRANGGILCIMGCDGVGKTSLANAIVKSIPSPAKSLRGKRLYRRSLLYKFFVWLLRPVFPLREKFDEFFVPFIYLRSCLGLGALRIFRGKRLYIIDRNVVDFLLLSRKTDKPRWSIFKFLGSFFGVRIPTVHCIADFDVVSMRKQEMSIEGHKLYDQMMFDHFAHRNPTDYTLFNNGRDLKSSCRTLSSIILSKEYPLSPSVKIRKNNS